MNEGEATSSEKGINGHLSRCGASASCLVFISSVGSSSASGETSKIT